MKPRVKPAEVPEIQTVDSSAPKYDANQNLILDASLGDAKDAAGLDPAGNTAEISAVDDEGKSTAKKDNLPKCTVCGAVLTLSETSDMMVERYDCPNGHGSFLLLPVPADEVILDPIPKTLDNTSPETLKANVSDVQIFGDPDTFATLLKVSSKSQYWMKSTKVCNVPGGCIVQVSTQQCNPDGSYAVAEALTYVPGAHIYNDDPERPTLGRITY